MRRMLNRWWNTFHIRVNFYALLPQSVIHCVEVFLVVRFKVSCCGGVVESFHHFSASFFFHFCFLIGIEVKRLTVSNCAFTSACWSFMCKGQLVWVGTAYKPLVSHLYTVRKWKELGRYCLRPLIESGECLVSTTEAGNFSCLSSRRHGWHLLLNSLSWHVFNSLVRVFIFMSNSAPLGSFKRHVKTVAELNDIEKVKDKVC